MPEYVFKLPDIGEGIAEAEIAAWHVGVGDDVAEDAPLVDMLTDKATVELTTPVGGRVVSISGAVGDLIATGGPLVVLETAAEEGTRVPAPDAQVLAVPVIADRVDADVHRPGTTVAAAEAKDPPPSQPASAPPTPPPPPAPSVQADASARTAPAPEATTTVRTASAAPAVRQRAIQLGIDLAQVHTASSNGRVRHSDLDAYMAYALRQEQTAAARVATGPSAPEGRREGVAAVRVVGLRRRIAERMSESKRRIPHFSYVEEVDVTDLEALRTDLNAEHGAARGKLTVLPFIVRALVAALPAFPQINARYDDEAGVVDRHDGVHVGIAAQTPTGLVVPVLRHAESHDLWSAGAEIARLAAAARDGRATASELAGSTITVSSLGPLGGVATTPVINHPEVAIVGVNKMLERPVVRGGAVAVRRMMNLSCSFDHRVVDGYDAAEFVQAVRRSLEQPARMFMR